MPSTQELSQLILVLIRIATFLVAAPVFNHPGILSRVKVGLAFFLSAAVWPTVIDQSVPVEMWPYIGAVLKEAVTGLLMGFAANLPFMAVRAAGEVASVGMGFTASRMTTAEGGQSTHASQLYWIAFSLVFITLNGHFWIVEVLGRSFVRLPLNAAELMGGSLAGYVVYAVGNLFIIGLQIGLPVIGMTFIIDVAMGLLARSVPQFNVFFFGFPLKILIGFAVMMFMFAYQFDSIGLNLIEETKIQLHGVMEGMASK